MKNSLRHSVWILTTIIRLVHSTCYVPNGTDRNANIDYDRYLPCTPGSDGFAMCCALGGSLAPDTCLHNGLCKGAGTGPIWRESCTDPTWESPSCIKLCTNSASSNSTDVVVQSCSASPNTFCCGNSPGNGQSCCDAGNGVFIVNGTTTTALPASTSSTSVTSSISTSSTSASPTAVVSHSSTNTGAVAGGVVGGVVALAIIAFMTWFIVTRRRRRSQDVVQPRDGSSIGAIEKDQDERKRPELDAKPPAELNSNLPHELQNDGSARWKATQERSKLSPRSPVELAG